MDVRGKSNALADLMARQLRVRSGSLAGVAGRAGRKLPRKLRDAVQVIVAAEAQSEHPKFAHHVDEKRVLQAEKQIKQFLEKQDPAGERRAEFLDRLAAIVFILFSLVVALFFFLLWRGYFD